MMERNRFLAGMLLGGKVPVPCCNRMVVLKLIWMPHIQFVGGEMFLEQIVNGQNILQCRFEAGSFKSCDISRLSDPLDSPCIAKPSVQHFWSAKDSHNSAYHSPVFSM